MRALIALTMTLGVLGCQQETTISNLVPRVAVAPGNVDFGQHAVPLAASTEMYVTNSGQARADINLALSGPDAGVFSLPFEEAEIAAGDTLTVAMGFVPATYLQYQASLIVTSNDLDNPEITVDVLGEGIHAPTPDIEIDRLTLDFGNVAGGSTVMDFINLTNAGDATLELGLITAGGSGSFSLGSDPSNALIGPGDTVPVIVQYSPSDDSGDNGSLSFASNDPDEPEVDVLLLGNGGSDIDYPVAEIDCPGTSAPPQWVALSASDSYDPEGHKPLEYEWTLSIRPPGSQAELTNLYTDATSLFTDSAGDYEVKLVVENAIGTRSAAARCNIAAIPIDELHVELSWDTSQADLDLHLLEDGVPFYQSPGDCNWCNKNPKWAADGTADDPRLDLDDQYGYGPENINILEPADGQYHVKVHYFDDHGDDAVTATVRIYAYQELVYQDSQVMHRNDRWDVAVVNWPDGTAGHVDTLEPEMTRACY